MPGILQKFESASKAIPAAIVAHPVLTAGGLVAAMSLQGMYDPMGPARNVQEAIMRERVGGSDAKYACAELQQHAYRKTYLDVKGSFEKVAVDPTVLVDPSTFAMAALAQASIDKTTGTAVDEGLWGIKRSISHVVNAIKDKFIDQPKRNKIMYNLMTKDPIISAYEKENPGEVTNAMSLMKSFAPNLSTNPAIVQAFLRNAAMSGGPIDYRTVKDLSDAEQTTYKTNLMLSTRGIPPLKK